MDTILSQIKISLTNECSVQLNKTRVVSVDYPMLKKSVWLHIFF